MKQPLNNNYPIGVEDIVSINTPIKPFIIHEAQFLNKQKQLETRNILITCDGISSKQIFLMKDGKYILEIDDTENDNCEYFYSNDILDLI